MCNFRHEKSVDTRNTFGYKLFALRNKKLSQLCDNYSGYETETDGSIKWNRCLNGGFCYFPNLNDAVMVAGLWVGNNKRDFSIAVVEINIIKDMCEHFENGLCANREWKIGLCKEFKSISIKTILKGTYDPKGYNSRKKLPVKEL